MQNLRCTGCGLRILELEGQFSVLDSLYISNGSPPEASSGWWHARCLAESDVASVWCEARLRNFRDVRRYHTVAEYALWTVLREPNRGKLLAFGRDGQILSLSRGQRERVRATAGGSIYPKTEERFYFEPEDIELVQTIQQQLVSSGSYPLIDTLKAMGISDKLVHAEALEYGLLRFDERLQPDWDARSVSVGVEYGVFVPSELEPHVGEFVR